MQIEIDADSLISLWRYLEKQPITVDDRERMEKLAVHVYDALHTSPDEQEKKRGRPVGSRNKKQGPEPLFPPGSTYSGEDELPVIQGEFK